MSMSQRCVKNCHGLAVLVADLLGEKLNVHCSWCELQEYAGDTLPVITNVMALKVSVELGTGAGVCIVWPFRERCEFLEQRSNVAYQKNNAPRFTLWSLRCHHGSGVYSSRCEAMLPTGIPKSFGPPSRTISIMKLMLRSWK